MGKTFGGLTLMIRSYSEVFATWLNNSAFGAKLFIIFHKEMPAMFFFLHMIWALEKADAERLSLRLAWSTQ